MKHGIRECRGHWHVTTADGAHDLAGYCKDEAAARELAAEYDEDDSAAAPRREDAAGAGHHAPHAKRFAVGEAEECAIGSYVRFEDYEALRRQYDATAEGYRAALLAARREAEAARVALNGIADHGWCYDGRVTFTINCVGMGDAKRLEALLFAASPARSDND